MKFWKTVGLLGLATAIGYGTFSETKLAPPVVTYRGEPGAGIQTGIISINNSTLYGLNCGILGTVNSGDTYGANLALLSNNGYSVSNSFSTIYGLEAALISNGHVWFSSLKKNRTEVHGVQASILYNSALENSVGLQIGLVNCVYDDKRNLVHWNPIFNVMSGRGGRK